MNDQQWTELPGVRDFTFTAESDPDPELIALLRGPEKPAQPRPVQLDYRIPVKLRWWRRAWLWAPPQTPPHHPALGHHPQRHSHHHRAGGGPVTSENDIGVTVHSTQPSLWYFNTDRAGNTAATELTGLINDSPLTELNTRDRAFAQALCQLATERLVDTAVTTSQPPN